MFLIVKQGQTRTIRIHVFLIITQGVIGSDKDTHVFLIVKQGHIGSDKEPRVSLSSHRDT